ncbi:uncharacterized protein LAJ45_07237 [Morchella importuna]|uniref:uncharacterized protein n=1 Tax=Morchella importuna TaxID=1174673 RepID=UPI001E8CD476|nr:uncharacterized protein LAJ45_07237 [Morchella importuna]KAH8148526.1 hypothetical protein LAJ45_07237 [Morchella importuna]
MVPVDSSGDFKHRSRLIVQITIHIFLFVRIARMRFMFPRSASLADPIPKRGAICNVHAAARCVNIIITNPELRDSEAGNTLISLYSRVDRRIKHIISFVTLFGSDLPPPMILNETDVSQILWEEAFSASCLGTFETCYIIRNTSPIQQASCLPGTTTFILISLKVRSKPISPRTVHTYSRSFRTSLGFPFVNILRLSVLCTFPNPS